MGSSLGSGLTALDPSGYLGGSKPREPETALERLKACSCYPSLSYRQRLLGSILCFAFGTVISLSALNSLGSLLLGNAAPFAFKYTLGNLLQIGLSPAPRPWAYAPPLLPAPASQAPPRAI